MGNLDLIEERMVVVDPRMRRQFDAARDAALRGAEVTRLLLAVARRQPLEMQSLNVNTLLLEMVPLVGTPWPGRCNPRSDAMNRVRAGVERSSRSAVVRPQTCTECVYC